MSLSNNRPNTFIPEKIVSLQNTTPSGWRSVTVPADGQNTAKNHFERYRQGAAGILQRGPDPEAETEQDAERSGEEASAPASGIKAEDIEILCKKAYDDGMRDGLEMADEDFGSSAKALLIACEQLNTIRETILNNSMEEMQNLVLTIAERFIRHSVTVQNDTLIATVEEAIRQSVKSDELTIEVNPADLEVIKSRTREFIDSLSGLENITMQTNPAIERGGCRIDSSTSTVDATITSQLRIIEKALKGND